MKSAVIVFPGSNCDRDVAVALEQATGKKPAMVWHGDSAMPKTDLIVLPGGFSYGDYLRCGAMAAHSAIMKDVIAKAKAGTPVLGICNGFQILCESGLLPGVLLRNASLKYVCKDVILRVERNDTMFTRRFHNKGVAVMPIAHGEGNYFADKRRSTGSRARARSRSATATRTARSRPRRIRTARSATSPASSTPRPACSA